MSFAIHLLRSVAVATWCAAAFPSLAGQAPTDSEAAAAPRPGSGPVAVTFARLAEAARHRTVETTQVRRFLDDRGTMVSLREHLIVAGDGSDRPPFRLTYVGVEGHPESETDSARWSQVYRRFASLLHEQGSFRIHSVEAAERNYVIHPIGSASRIGRTVDRVVVLPHVLDKSIWLLEVDRATGLVLRATEYDNRVRILSEIEVQSLAVDRDAVVPGGDWAWRPRLQVTPFATVEAALAAQDMAHVVLPSLGSAVPEYRRHQVQLTKDPLNGRISLVIAYSDGIDSFFVIQSPGQPDPFQGLPSSLAPPGAARPHTIAYYDDPSLRVYVFHHGGVDFTVAGRGSLSRLGRLSRSIYRQAIGA